MYVNCIFVVSLISTVALGAVNPDTVTVLLPGSGGLNPVDPTNQMEPACDPTCSGPNEKCGWGSDIFGCDDKCESMQAQYVEARPCPLYVVQKCVCNKGYARNDKGRCIPKRRCPCKSNEKRPSCGNSCGQTCDTIDDMCTMQCDPVKPGQCVCDEGYTRYTKVSQQCVKVEICREIQRLEAALKGSSK